tara:strand:+ start:360 stop:659 length:300 start_codon:yes stop_codon:yes gene_type:complete
MTNFAGVSGGHLKQFIERIERLEEDKIAVTADIKEVYAELKSQGFDPKIIRKVISLRKMDQDERAEHEELLSVYLNALDMASKPQFSPSTENDDSTEAA